MLRIVCGKMRGECSSEGPTKAPDFASDPKVVNQELQYFLSIVSAGKGIRTAL